MRLKNWHPNKNRRATKKWKKFAHSQAAMDSVTEKDVTDVEDAMVTKPVDNSPVPTQTALNSSTSEACNTDVVNGELQALTAVASLADAHGTGAEEAAAEDIISGNVEVADKQHTITMDMGDIEEAEIITPALMDSNGNSGIDSVTSDMPKGPGEDQTASTDGSIDVAKVADGPELAGQVANDDSMEQGSKTDNSGSLICDDSQEPNDTDGSNAAEKKDVATGSVEESVDESTPPKTENSTDEISKTPMSETISQNETPVSANIESDVEESNVAYVAEAAALDKADTGASVVDVNTLGESKTSDARSTLENGGISCEHCFQEVMLDELQQCIDGHVFCDACLRRRLKTFLASDTSKLVGELPCLYENCDGFFSEDMVRKVAPINLFEQYQENQRSINISIVEGLVNCPNCDFMAILADSETKCFGCLKCLTETCVKCRKSWDNHYGKSCEDAAANFQVCERCKSSSHEGMTCEQAKLRIILCPVCKLGLMRKGEKTIMSCNCGSTCCFLCQKIIDKEADNHACLVQGGNGVEIGATMDATSRPANWTVMPKDGNDIFISVPLEEGDEKDHVLGEFKKTVGSAGGFTDLKVDRIQNPCLYKLYKTQKEFVAARCKKRGIAECEKFLFHGTTKDSTNSINMNGFSRSYAGKNGSAIGKGVYFSPTSYGSFGFAKPDAGGQKYIYYGPVLVGEYVQGHSGMLVPPQLPDNTGTYDSVVDNMTNPGMFVVFSDYAAYPYYVIRFR